MTRVERGMTVRQSLQRLDRDGRSVAVDYVTQNMASQIEAIRRWVGDPSQELTVDLAQINLLRFAVFGNPLRSDPDLGSFMGDLENVKKARKHLQVNAWQQEIANINARLDNDTYIRGGHGDRERQELPLPESKRSRMLVKKERLEELFGQQSPRNARQRRHDISIVAIDGPIELR